MDNTGKEDEENTYWFSTGSPLSSPGPILPLVSSQIVNTPPRRRPSHSPIADVGIAPWISSPSPRRRDDSDHQPLPTVIEADLEAFEEARVAEDLVQEEIEPVFVNEPPVQHQLDVNALQDALRYLASRNLTWGDLVEYVSDPRYKQGAVRWRGLFRDPERVKRILTLWTSWRAGQSTRQTISEWVLAWMERRVNTEARASTKDGFLQSRLKPLDKTFILGFNMAAMHERLRTLCPTFISLVRAFCTTAKQRKKSSVNSEQRKETRVASVIMDLLGERSQLNSYKKHIFGLFTYATGGSRQMISVLNTLGISSSYQTLAGTQKRTGALAFSIGGHAQDVNVLNNEDSVLGNLPVSEPTLGEQHSDDEPDSDTSSQGGGDVQEVEKDGHAVEQAEGTEPSNVTRASQRTGRPRSMRDPLLSFVGESDRHLGLLRSISLSCRLEAKNLVRRTPVQHVYDNINVMRKTEEQTLGHKDEMQNGTCATVFPLFDASVEDMRTADLLESQDKARPLAITDIHLASNEASLLRECLIHNILRIVLAFGGPGFARFREEILKSQPVTQDKIPVHTTDTYPLPSMPIDESSNTGNAQVVDTIFKELEYDETDPRLLSTGTVKIVSGDQLSISRIRTVSHNRAGHDSVQRSYLDLVFSPGIFHAQMHATFGILDTHWGNPKLGPRDPGSLSFHNTVLDRKPIVLSSLPPYRVCRELAFVSLYARVLHCLELVSGKSLADYPKSASFANLREHAALIYDRYADVVTVDRLRASRAEELRKQREGGHEVGEDEVYSEGDMVLENAILYLRDVLLVREFADAVKIGDSGRMVLVLKTFAFMYRGTGRAKYAHEMLHLIHNLSVVWPEQLRKVVLKNWLVNPSGHTTGFIPVDLLQEHMNLYIKTIYKAHGSNASWEWLEIISPCIKHLRALSTQMYDAFGTKQGNKHAPPDLSKDINELMKSLREHHVYKHVRGRSIEGNSAVIPDVISKGLSETLTPLRDYNEAFDRMRRRRRLNPLLGQPIKFKPTPAATSASEPATTAAETVGAAGGAEDSLSIGGIPTGTGPFQGASSECAEHQDTASDAGSVNTRDSAESWVSNGGQARSESEESCSSDGESEEDEAESDKVEDNSASEQLFSLNSEDDVDLFMY